MEWWRAEVRKAPITPILHHSMTPSWPLWCRRVCHMNGHRVLAVRLLRVAAGGFEFAVDGHDLVRPVHHKGELRLALVQGMADDEVRVREWEVVAAVHRPEQERR